LEAPDSNGHALCRASQPPGWHAYASCVKCVQGWLGPELAQLTNNACATI
jgi:hypothetical protein